MKRKKETLISCIAIALLGQLPTAAIAQCATTYQDGGAGSNSIYVWSTLTDNYTSPYTGCAPSWGNFTHSYTTYITLYAASGRTASGAGGGQQSGGEGTGSSYAEAILTPQDDSDYGLFSFSASDAIFCSVAGNLYSDTPMGNGFAPTPSKHTYPQGPFGSLGCLVRDNFDTVRSAGRHSAQDVKYPGVQIGDPVQSMEAGTVVAVYTGRVHADTSSTACKSSSGHPQPNAVGIQGSDQHVTWYRHVAASVTSGQQVSAGTVIGHLDNSGCWNGAHTHIDRRVSFGSRIAENFTIQNCPGSAPSQYVDDGLDDETVDNVDDY